MTLLQSRGDESSRGRQQATGRAVRPCLATSPRAQVTASSTRADRERRRAPIGSGKVVVEGERERLTGGHVPEDPSLLDPANRAGEKRVGGDDARGQVAGANPPLPSPSRTETELWKPPLLTTARSAGPSRFRSPTPTVNGQGPPLG